MPNVKVIKIVFDTVLKTHEIPAFRGAIISMVGRDQVIFHNHLGEKQFHYAYPLVQYKKEAKNAGIVCIGDGVEQIHHFFTKNDGVIKIGNSRRPLHVENVKINRFNVQIGSQNTSYRVNNWLALNERNFEKYQQMDSIQEKLLFLEKILTGNVLSFAKGIGWTVDKPIQTSITNLPEISWLRHKGVKLMAMNLEFKTNVSLPFDIGLGKGASVGFGSILKKQ